MHRLGLTRLVHMTCLALLALVMWSASLPAGAQNSRGTILGHVTDSSGAAVASAKATVRNVNTNTTGEYITDASGDFVFVNLIPGTYESTVAAAGFKSAAASGLVVEVDQNLRQDFVLTVGSVAEEVKVEASTQMLQTDNANIGTVISGQMIDDLPYGRMRIKAPPCRRKTSTSRTSSAAPSAARW